MGKATYYLGSNIGQATKMKLVVNSIMGNMLACLAEGKTFNGKRMLVNLSTCNYCIPRIQACI